MVFMSNHKERRFSPQSLGFQSPELDVPGTPCAAFLRLSFLCCDDLFFADHTLRWADLQVRDCVSYSLLYLPRLIYSRCLISICQKTNLGPEHLIYKAAAHSNCFWSWSIIPCPQFWNSESSESQSIFRAIGSKAWLTWTHLVTWGYFQSLSYLG